MLVGWLQIVGCCIASQIIGATQDIEVWVSLPVIYSTALPWYVWRKGLAWSCGLCYKPKAGAYIFVKLFGELVGTKAY